MPNKTYWLENDEVKSRPATEDELRKARDEALAKIKANSEAFSMRSCWVCNPAHRHFLTDPNDGFLFRCAWGCGRVYYGGMDITEGGPE